MSLSENLCSVPHRSARTCLREATMPWHARLEQTAFAQVPLSADVSTRDYAGHLATWFAVIAPLEERIVRCLSAAEARALAGCAWRYAPRQADLARDLAALGEPVTMPAPAVWPSHLLPTSTWTAIGAAYVLEGSRLGGQLIARHLRASLGEAVPLAYYGGGLAQWHAFLSVLELEDAMHNLEHMVSGAVEAFCGIHECVTGVSTPRAA
ncbi:biliverdin-producing heme oxygenase [Nitrogeniibacter aestuarii]|uniref:biliverdin-producing heme oxygenase n=1 Tax=Nitrogeniibacter aestuarii TaxID=2815343 RepID=UPI001D101149|nr:biliverdin-producing heme oxygenase [Nitrogeniibacter aestuarii]